METQRVRGPSGSQTDDTPLRRGLRREAVRLVESGAGYAVLQHRGQPHVFAVVEPGAELDKWYERGFTRVAAGVGQIVAQLAAPSPDGNGRADEAEPKRLILYIHGYNNPSDTVAQRTQEYPNGLQVDAAHEIWVTFDWAGEGAFRRRAWGDAIGRGGELASYLVSWLGILLGLLLLLGGGGFAGWRASSTPGWGAVPVAGGPPHPVLRGLAGMLLALGVPLAVVFPLLLLFLAWPLQWALPFLRFCSYPRDRYMAMHHGVPDLTGFLRDLDHQYYQSQPAANREGAAYVLEHPARIVVDMIAHSMGCLLTLNLIRALAEQFGRDPHVASGTHLGQSMRMGTLALVAADVPVALLQVSKSNYFSAAMDCFERMVVFSSAYDAVLRVFGYYVNSFAEPQPGLGRYRLGNVFHPPAQPRPPLTDQLAERPWTRSQAVFHNRLQGLSPRSRTIQQQVAFIDCSERPTLCARGVRGFNGFPPMRDAGTLLLYFAGVVDCHAGYFRDWLVWNQIQGALRGPHPAVGARANKVLPADDYWVVDMHTGDREGPYPSRSAAAAALSTKAPSPAGEWVILHPGDRRYGRSMPAAPEPAAAQRGREKKRRSVAEPGDPTGGAARGRSSANTPEPPP